MGKTYETQSLVELPGQLSADDLITLSQHVITVGQAEKSPLPPRVAKALKRIVVAHKAFAAARATTPAPPPSTRAQYDASLEVGRSWSGLSEFLESFTRVKRPEAAIAARLQRTLFADGMAWARRKNKRVWGESQRRTAWLRAEPHAAELAALGAGPFVAAIEEAHKALGTELGLTPHKGVAPAAPAEAADHAGELRGTMKSYILQVAAHVDDAPEDADLGRRLLAPFAEWESAPAQKAAAGGEPPPKTVTPAT